MPLAKFKPPVVVGGIEAEGHPTWPFPWKLDMPLEVAPTQMEEWHIDSIIVDLHARSAYKYEFEVLTREEEEREKTIAKLEEQILKQASIIENTKKVFEKQVGGSQAQFEWAATNGEAEAKKVELEGQLHTLKLEKYVVGLSEVATGINQPYISYFLELYRGHFAELLFSQQLDPAKTLAQEGLPTIGGQRWVQAITTELLKQRIALPIPVVLNPGETMFARLTINLPEDRERTGAREGFSLFNITSFPLPEPQGPTEKTMPIEVFAGYSQGVRGQAGQQ